MSILATQTAGGASAAASTPRHSQGVPVLRSIVMLGIALILLVPESELRAKAFKVNLIVKNMQRHAH